MKAMLIRDRLRARLAEMRGEPDYVRLAAEVLGIRNAPPALARRLVDQAMVIEDRREQWLRDGERICESAPAVPGVYLLRDAEKHVLYVGKANNLRRRLRTHFAARRWRRVNAEFARAADAEWRTVGSEIEALFREAIWIRDFSPSTNVQVGTPSFDTRAVPAKLLRDTIVVLPSVEETAVELLGVRALGPAMLVRVQRDGSGLARRATVFWKFFTSSARAADVEASIDTHDRFAPVVFSWLAGRGAGATRLDPHDAGSARELQRRLSLLLEDQRLFLERIVVLRSGWRSRSSNETSASGRPGHRSRT
jgi:hypothetical protein